LKLEICDVPDRLRRWQWVEYLDPNGYSRLVRSLRTRVKDLGLTAPRPPIAPTMSSPSVTHDLTHREQDVLVLISRRYTDKDIAEALGITERDVSYAMGYLAAKLGARGRRRIVERARDMGLLSTEPNQPHPLPPKDKIAGSVNVESNNVTIDNDVVGRDKIIQAGTYIEHATIVQSGASAQEIKPSAPTSTDNRRVIGGIEFVRVPAGQFIMGSKADNRLAYDDEKPQHTVEIPYDYWMARYPVTKEQFSVFVAEMNYKFDQGSWMDNATHPVVSTIWLDAMNYCKWLQERLRKELDNLALRLPTEAEWEKAARGEYGNEWPWGNEFDQDKCNSSEGGKGGTTPVGAYSPQGDSPYGIADMVGNVWEWCHSLYKPYPYKPDDSRESELELGHRVLRGGASYTDKSLVRCAYRSRDNPNNRYKRSFGFRLVLSPGPRF
jgi:formylglycine-generating enzyme required for sulfatase activity/DNA-binding CsgD family transcriptional regulator